MTYSLEKTKYEIITSSKFRKSYKKIKAQKKDIKKLIYVLKKLANGEKLESKYKDHNLINDGTYKNCRECHIESDWLLIYKIVDEQLLLLLFDTGSHSKLFR